MVAATLAAAVVLMALIEETPKAGVPQSCNGLSPTARGTPYRYNKRGTAIAFNSSVFPVVSRRCRLEACPFQAFGF